MTPTKELIRRMQEEAGRDRSEDCRWSALLSEASRRLEKAQQTLWLISQHEGYTRLHPDESAPDCCQREFAAGVTEGYGQLAQIARDALKEMGDQS